MARRLTDAQARRYALAGDEVRGTFTGKWTTSTLDPTRNAAMLAGGVLLAGLVSRDGEAAWVVATRWAYVIVGASKVTGGPAKVIDALLPETPLDLGGKRGNRLELGRMTLVVPRSDLGVVAALAAEVRPPIDWSRVPGRWPYAPFSILIRRPPHPETTAGVPGPAESPPPPGRRTSAWTPAPGARVDADEPAGTGLADLFSKPPPNGSTLGPGGR